MSDRAAGNVILLEHHEAGISWPGQWSSDHFRIFDARHLKQMTVVFIPERDDVSIGGSRV